MSHVLTWADGVAHVVEDVRPPDRLLPGEEVDLHLGDGRGVDVVVLGAVAVSARVAPAGTYTRSAVVFRWKCRGKNSHPPGREVDPRRGAGLHPLQPGGADRQSGDHRLHPRQLAFADSN